MAEQHNHNDDFLGLEGQGPLGKKVVVELVLFNNGHLLISISLIARLWYPPYSFVTVTGAFQLALKGEGSYGISWHVQQDLGSLKRAFGVFWERFKVQEVCRDVLRNLKDCLGKLGGSETSSFLHHWSAVNIFSCDLLPIKISQTGILYRSTLQQCIEHNIGCNLTFGRISLFFSWWLAWFLILDHLRVV